MARLTGAVLAGGATATIGLPGDTGADTQLPANFPTDPGIPGLNMSDVVIAMVVEAAAAGGAGSHYHVTQQDNPFRFSVVNDTGGVQVTLELFIQYVHSLIR